MVRTIGEKLSGRYASIAPLLLANGSIALILYSLYRFRVFRYMRAIYPDLASLSLPGYLKQSLHFDGLAFFWTMTAVLLLLLAVAGSRRLKYLLSGALSVIFIFFILFSMEFFRVYQTTFQKNFAGKEHFSGLGNVLDSALAEFSLEFYLLFLVLSTLSLGTMFLLYRRGEGNNSRTGTSTEPASAGSMAPRAIVPAAAIVSLIAGLLTGPPIPVKAGTARVGDETARAASLMHELTMNPVYNLFSFNPSGPDEEPVKHDAGRLFSFGLNTDSMESSRSHPRRDSIPRPKPYNIILYFFESTPYKYYDHTINGRQVIPAWHRLENNSLNFRRHYANYPLSANALLSVLTSAYDHNSKEMVIQKYPDIGLRTLPEILKTRGYRTCLIHTGGLGYAGQKRFLQKRKFDRIIEYNELIGIPPYNRQVGWGVDERAMIEPAASFIGKDPGAPFFLVLLPVNPHHPYAVPDDSFRIAGNTGGGDNYRDRNWRNYLDSLHYSDAALGMLVDELERRGLMEDTLLFLFADHGEAFYQHRMNYNHPLFIYEENVHVPFLIYNRRLFPSPEYYDGISRHIDILPTVIDILGIPPSPEQEGISLLSRHREQMALIHTSWKDDYMGIVDRQWKYIRRTSDGVEELYDLHEDPEEKRNIAALRGDITGMYRAFVTTARDYRREYYRRMIDRK